MPDHLWKKLEREVAAELQSERNKRGRDFSESMPDVVASFYDIWDIRDEDLGYSCISAECKYRKDQPFIRKYATKRTSSGEDVYLIGGYVFFHLQDFSDFERFEKKFINYQMGGTVVDKELPSYLVDYYQQAQDYDPYNGEGPPDLKPFPLVVLRMKGNTTLLAYTEEKHIRQLIEKLKG